MGRNEVRIDLTLKGDKATERGLHNVGDAAEDAGKSFDGMATEAGHLDKKIGELAKTHKELIQQLDSTGDVDLLKSIRKNKRDLRMFEGLRKELDDVVPDITKAGTGAGMAFGQSLMTSAGTAISSGGPYVIAAAAGVAALAVPLIGASIAAGVLGGVGAGGLIGGIAAASQDPRVKAAADDFLTAAMSEATDIAQPFVEPLTAAIDYAAASIQDLGDDVGPAVGDLAQELGPLAKGVGEMAKELVPGLLAGIKAAQPVLRVIANELPEFGAAFSDAFEMISDDPDGAILALHDLLRLGQDTIRLFGLVVGVLSQTYETLYVIGDAVTDIFTVFNSLPGGMIMAELNAALGESADALAASDEPAMKMVRRTNEIGKSADEAAAELDGMKDAIDRVFGVQMSVDQATLNWHKGLGELRKELMEGGKTLSLFSAEGQKNRDAMLDQIRKAEDMRRATAEQTGDLPAANAAFQKHIDEIYNMGKAAGFTKDELDKLLGPYRDGPVEAIVEFRTPGLLAAISRVKILKELLGSTVGAVNPNDPFAPGRAHGGSVYDGQTYLVGEQGPELLRMNGNGHVYTAGQTSAMLAGAGRAAAGAGSRPLVSIAVTPSGNAAFDALVQALWPFILKQVRVDGGDLSAFGASN